MTEGNWSPGERVPRSGIYTCLYCGPNGMGTTGTKLAMQKMGLPYTPPASARKEPPRMFFKEGDTFPSCPNCKGDPSGSDPTGWEFVSEKEEVAPTDQAVETYFECTRPSGDGTCSDNDCPCGHPGANIPRGTGYFYISKELVEMRRDALSIDELQKKVLKMQNGIGATALTAGSGVFMPILMCEMGANKRGINKEVASDDARHWWKTGLAPLRPTPMDGQTVVDDGKGSGNKNITAISFIYFFASIIALFTLTIIFAIYDLNIGFGDSLAGYLWGFFITSIFISFATSTFSVTLDMEDSGWFFFLCFVPGLIGIGLFLWLLFRAFNELWTFLFT